MIHIIIMLNITTVSAGSILSPYQLMFAIIRPSPITSTFGCLAVSTIGLVAIISLSKLARSLIPNDDLPFFNLTNDQTHKSGHLGVLGFDFQDGQNTKKVDFIAIMGFELIDRKF